MPLLREDCCCFCREWRGARLEGGDGKERGKENRIGDDDEYLCNIYINHSSIVELIGGLAPLVEREGCGKEGTYGSMR